jgi:KilA-N domain
MEDTLSRSFKGVVVQRRSSDGFFNATEMCKVFKKNFKDYMKRKDASDYLDALARMLTEAKMSFEDPEGTIVLLDFDAARTFLVKVQHGGEHRGSWLESVCASVNGHTMHLAARDRVALAWSAAP